MTSKTDIANIALTEIGAKPIADVDIEQNEAARAIRARWNDVRDAVLRAHPWNCAIRRTTLAAAGTPAFGWDVEYQLPQGGDVPYCLRVLQVNNSRKTKFRVEGRKILCNVPAPLKLLYIARIEDTAQWDANLVQACGLYLAHSVAYRLTSNRGIEQAMREKYIQFLREARSIDAQEGTPPDPDEDLSSFEEARL